LKVVQQRQKIAILAIFPLHILSRFGSRFSPSGHYATWLPQIAGAWQDQKEFEIHWLTGSALVGQTTTVNELNQTFHVYPIAEKGRAASCYRRDRREIQKILGKIQPNLVHAWGTEDVCGYAAVRSGYPCILSLQGIHTNLIRHGVHHPRVYFQALLEAYCLARADWVTVESEWGREKIRPFRWGRTMEIVEYGAHPRFFKAQRNLVYRPPTFLFIGTVCPQKGIQDCVAAFRHPRLSNARLEVYGSGQPRYLHRLKAISPPNVNWKGRQEPEVIVAALEAAWGLLLPTRADTSPNVVKEARVVGLPVIASPNGGHLAYVKDGEDGFIVKCGAIEELVRRLEELTNGPDKVVQMGNLGRNRYRQLFQPERTAKRFFSLYKKLTGANL
jgi:glycosyltransferase involved in cell wall biosynthesis